MIALENTVLVQKRTPKQVRYPNYWTSKSTNVYGALSTSLALSRFRGSRKESDIKEPTLYTLVQEISYITGKGFNNVVSTTEYVQDIKVAQKKGC